MDKMSSYASQIQEPGQGGGNFIQQIKIRKDSPNVLRLVDTPNGVERYYISWCLCDDDKKRPFIIENDREGKSILSQMLGDREHFYKGGILESVKDEVTNTGRLVHQEKDPELLLRIAYNNDPSGSDGSWKPREEYMFNALQRWPDTDESGNLLYWCKENKHTKALVMGIMAFKRLQDVRLNDGELSEYDINYIKKGAGFSTQHNILKAGANLPNVVIGPISEEEAVYQRYDLIHETSLSSAPDILKYLRNQIERVDKVMNSSWLRKLEEQAGMTPANPEVDLPQQEALPQPTPAPESTPATRLGGRVPVQEQKMEPCNYCKKMIPVGSEFCPECKTTLLEPCVKCGTKFSVLATVCPGCGKQYKLG
jgi:RNA polymerase subunit RPABC4/transcription elongation factor Spt4